MINIQSLSISIKKSKIAPVVCPVTEHTEPLMPIGGYPANTMVSQGLSWDWWGRSQVLKMGAEGHQANQSYKLNNKGISYNSIVLRTRMVVNYSTKLRLLFHKWI